MKLVVFDFDGTLVNSRALILESHRRIFAEFGLPVPDPRDSLALIGRSLGLVLEQLAGPAAPIDDMVRAYGRLLPQLRSRPEFAEEPFDGISDLLHDLNRVPDTSMGIATGHASAAVLPALEALGWRGLFQTIQAADLAPSKPHPGMLLQALEATGASADDAIFIGDTTFDIEMARAAGVRPIGVSWGYHDAPSLAAAGAHHVAHAVDELRAVVRDFVDGSKGRERQQTGG